MSVSSNDENLGLLGIGDIKDIICYHSMSDIDKEDNMLFKGITKEQFIQNGRGNVFAKYFGFSIDNNNDTKQSHSIIKHKINNRNQVNKHRKQKYVFVSLLNMTK